MLIDLSIDVKPVKLTPPTALLFRGKSRIVQPTSPSSLRKWRSRKLAERGKQRLVLEIRDGVLIDTLVASGRLTERDTAEDGPKVQARSDPEKVSAALRNIGSFSLHIYLHKEFEPMFGRLARVAVNQ